MWLCYAIVLIPVVLGAFLWLRTRRITFGEWMGGAAIGLLVAVGFHVYAVVTMTLDARIASGRVAYATFYPRYPGGEKEDGWGDQWVVTLDLGDGGRADFEIPKEEFEEILAKFGNPPLEAAPPDARSPSKDEYRVHIARNRTGVLIPGWTIRSARRQAGGPDLFTFSEPPEGLPLHDYPFMTDWAVSSGLIADVGSGPYVVETEYQEIDWRRSGRLLGRAAGDIDIAKWDAINAELAPTTGVNLIAIGFEGDSSLARWQEAKWQGGKRNDLVICYGPSGEGGKPSWTYCFGWTETEIVKRSLESLFLTRGASDEILPQVRDEVAAHYRPRAWPEFSYFAIRPPRAAIGILILLTIVIQGRYWLRAYFDRDRREAADAEEVADEAEEARRSGEKGMKARIREELSHLGKRPDVATLTQEMVRGIEPYLACRALAFQKDPAVRGAMVHGLFSKLRDVNVIAEDWLNEHVPDPADCEEVRAEVPFLIDSLSDQEDHCRRTARRVLPLIDPNWRDRNDARDGVSRLLAELRTTHPRQRHFDGLGARGPLVYDGLLEMSGETGKVTEVHGLKALGHTGDLRAVPLLLKRLDAEKDLVRRYAASGLANFGPGLKDAPEVDRILTRAVSLLVADEKGGRASAVRILGWLGDEEAVPDLIPHLRNADKTVRYWTSDALGRIGGPDAIAALLESLDDEAATHPDLTGRAIALGLTKDESIVAPLLALYRSDRTISLPVMEAIIDAVHLLGGEEVERFLERAADPMGGPDSDHARRRLMQRREGRGIWS